MIYTDYIKHSLPPKKEDNSLYYRDNLDILVGTLMESGGVILDLSSRGMQSLACNTTRLGEEVSQAVVKTVNLIASGQIIYAFHTFGSTISKPFEKATYVSTSKARFDFPFVQSLCVDYIWPIAGAGMGFVKAIGIVSGVLPPNMQRRVTTFGHLNNIASHGNNAYTNISGIKNSADSPVKRKKKQISILSTINSFVSFILAGAALTAFCFEARLHPVISTALQYGLISTRVAGSVLQKEVKILENAGQLSPFERKCKMALIHRV